MTGDDQASTPMPMPVTPSPGSERPAGVAFDVAKGTEPAGVAVGDQTPADPDAAARIEATVRETGAGPPAGLAVPGDPGAMAQPRDDFPRRP